MKIIFDNVSLEFNGNNVFTSLNLEFSPDNIYVIKGENGSGKSSLLKLAAHLLRPTVGKIIPKENEKELKGREYQNKIAMLSPDMRLYENLTATENLRFFAGLRGIKLTDGEILNLWAKVGLKTSETTDKFSINLSTGMGQRVKFAILLSANAPVWLLDEPTANLDDAGRETFAYEVTKARKNKIILWATNDKRDFDMADKIVDLRK